MTFSSNLTQEAFHKLPTETQVTWKELENHLAESGQGIHVLAVMISEEELEVTVRIDSKRYGYITTDD